MKKNFHIYKERLNQLKDLIKQEYKQNDGVILFFADLESESCRFKQESNFYYFTGLEEPAVIFTSGIAGATILHVPAFLESRAKWIPDYIFPDKNLAKQINVDDIVYLGEPFKGYVVTPFVQIDHYKNVIDNLAKLVSSGLKIYTTNFSKKFSNILDAIPGSSESIIDITHFAARLRRKKTKNEIEMIYKSIDCTMAAHESAAVRLEPGIMEYQLQAAIEFIFTETGANPAFPSIVASGKNSTILHYHKNNALLNSGDLVVVDVGAQIDYYCADLTRTYPVSGEFTKRQKFIYDLVLKTQEHVFAHAKPGYWLNNSKNPEKSLNHIAKNFLAKQGYDKYFTHSIGHFLGIDVHDVGDYAQPLQPGDVITIEPGIYIPEESIGVRIEDNYWIIEDGAICLSEDLAKESDEISELVRFDPNQEDEQDEDFD